MPVCFRNGQSTTGRDLPQTRRCARDAKRNFRQVASETEITACRSWSQEQSWVVIALRNEKRLPRSWPVWFVVTEVSSGSVRRILPGEEYSCLRGRHPVRRHRWMDEARRSGVRQGKGLARQ